MLRSSDILRFYLPLVLTSQMMTLSGPIINVGIGRSADPTIEFAGYWLGFAVLLFLESPCLSVQQISATLIGNTPSIPRLIRVALSFGVLSTLLILTVALIDPVSAWIFRTVVPTTPRVAEVARTVLLLQSPIPLLLCLRGLANGFAIRQKRTDLVARATVVRLVTLSLGVGLFVAGASGSGAIAGAVALVTGIALETATVLWSVSRKARTAWHQTTVGSPAPYRFILRVALPLVVAGTTWTALRPIINAALGTLPDPERAQAGFGVVLPFVLATCSPLWIMHNVTLVLPRSVRDLRIVARFAAGTSLFFALLVLLVTWTGLRHWLLRDVFGLNDALAADVTPAIRIVAVEPFLLAGRGFAQGILMHARRTEAMLYTAPVKLVVVAALGLSVAHHSPEVNGALLGTALFLTADLLDAGVFLYTARRLLRAGRVFERVAPKAAPEAVPLSGRDPESQRV